MEQYIPKSVLVVEIERLRKKNDDYNKPSHIADVCYKEIISLIDTLEVKEVDLEKEIKNEIDEYWYDNDYGAIQRHGGTVTMEVSDVKDIAKYFFELGLKAQK